MDPLSKNEFLAALSKGLGRAVIHVKEYGALGFRKELLYACLNNLVFDPQCEGERAPWLFSMIELTGEKEYFRDQIVQAIPGSMEYHVTRQLIGIAKEFALRGCNKSKKAIYDKFDLQQLNETWVVGYEIIELGGMQGLFHVVEIVGKRLSDDPESWESDCLLDRAKELLGEEFVMAALTKRAKKNKNVRTYLGNINSLKEIQIRSKEEKTKSVRERLPLTKILADIESSSGFPGTYTIFGKHAREEDIAVIFKRLISETRRDQLLRYLWIFRRRQLPQLCDYLFELAASEDKKIRYAAITSLSNSHDPSIHELAIKLLNKANDYKKLDAIALLIKNYKPNDYKIIESILTVPKDQDDLFGIAYNIIKLCENHKNKELKNCLLWVYENTPCACCRKKAVKILVDTNQAPEHILNECLDDCSEDIRNLAKKYL